MTRPEDIIKVEMTREELEELAASGIKELMDMMNEVRTQLKANPSNACRRLDFIAHDIIRLKDMYIVPLSVPIELEAV